MSEASGAGSGDPPRHPPASNDACKSCPALQTEIEKLKEIRAQLRSEVDALEAENTSLEASTAQERQTAAMYARRVADLQPTLDTLSSESTSLSQELEELQQTQAEAPKGTGE